MINKEHWKKDSKAENFPLKKLLCSENEKRNHKELIERVLYYYM
jgi:hypothetical protein